MNIQLNKDYVNLYITFLQIKFRDELKSDNVAAIVQEENLDVRDITNLVENNYEEFVEAAGARISKGESPDEIRRLISYDIRAMQDSMWWKYVFFYTMLDINILEHVKLDNLTLYMYGIGLFVDHINEAEVDIEIPGSYKEIPSDFINIPGYKSLGDIEHHLIFKEGVEVINSRLFGGGTDHVDGQEVFTEVYLPNSLKKIEFGGLNFGKFDPVVYFKPVNGETPFEVDTLDADWFKKHLKAE